MTHPKVLEEFGEVAFVIVVAWIEGDGLFDERSRLFVVLAVERVNDAQLIVESRHLIV